MSLSLLDFDVNEVVERPASSCSMLYAAGAASRFGIDIACAAFVVGDGELLIKVH